MGIWFLGGLSSRSSLQLSWFNRGDPRRAPVLCLQPTLSVAQRLCGAYGTSQAEVALPQWGAVAVGVGFCLPTSPALCSHSWHPWRWSVYHWVQVGPWCFEWLAGGCVAGAPLGWRSHRRPAGKLLPSEGSCRCGRGVHAHIVSRRTPRTGMHQQSSFSSRRPLTPPHSLSSWRVHVGDSAGLLCCSLGGDRWCALRLVHSCVLYV